MQGVTVETKLQGETIGAEQSEGAARIVEAVGAGVEGIARTAAGMVDRRRRRRDLHAAARAAARRRGGVFHSRQRHCRRCTTRPISTSTKPRSTTACGFSPASPTACSERRDEHHPAQSRPRDARAARASGRRCRAIDRGARHRCRSADAQPGDVDRLRDGRCRREGDGGPRLARSRLRAAAFARDGMAVHAGRQVVPLHAAAWREMA